MRLLTFEASAGAELGALDQTGAIIPLSRSGGAGHGLDAGADRGGRTRARRGRRNHGGFR